jgi:hypothetical protein
VRIEDGRGGNEVYELKGLILTGHVTLSPNGSYLLIEYADTEHRDSSGNAPERVAIIRV